MSHFKGVSFKQESSLLLNLDIMRVLKATPFEMSMSIQARDKIKEFLNESES